MGINSWGIRGQQEELGCKCQRYLLVMLLWCLSLAGRLTPPHCAEDIAFIYLFILFAVVNAPGETCGSKDAHVCWGTTYVINFLKFE